MGPNFKILEQLLTEYPKLKIILQAGAIAMKASRNILSVSREEMYCIYTTMLEAGLVKGVSSSVFRAIPEVEQWFKVHSG